jgi:hypothetical protein
MTSGQDGEMLTNKGRKQSRPAQRLREMAETALIEHASVGGRNSDGGTNPKCLCNTCRLARGVLRQVK